MRHAFGVAAVIVAAMGLGGYSASISAGVKIPVLDWLRPPSATAATERVATQEKQHTIQVEASGCKYCADMAELAKTFSRRAELARTNATALADALEQGADEGQLAERRQDELKAAKLTATRAEAAASILTGWASRCSAQAFCKLPVTHVSAQTCAGQDKQRSAAALLIAMSVRTAAEQCASSECPSVDCRSSAALGSDIDRIEGALDEIGGNVSTAPVKSLSELPVGASTLKGEIARVSDETKYVANMLPLLLDVTKAQATADLPKLAPSLADERAVSAAELAVVMEQAAAVGDIKNDPRTEAAWRLKSLAADLAALGRETRSSTVDWQHTADSLGAGLMELARLQALIDRRSDSASASCDGSVASVAQQLREARAMLDHCRMRSACMGRGGAEATTKVSSGDLDEVLARATVSAQALNVTEVGTDSGTVQAAAGGEPSVIDMLRSHGVCRKAAELHEAALAAPAATSAVVQAAVQPTLSPSTGAISPQDLVTGAVQSALNAPAQAPAAQQGAEVVQTSAPVAKAHKPAPPAEAELTPAVAPVAPAEAAPELSTFGNGTGGPALYEEPAGPKK